MLVSALQMPPAPCNKAENLRRITQAAQAASSLGSALLVTPEMSLTGYAIWDQIPTMAEPLDGFLANALLSVARSCNIALVAGLPERDGEMIYNSALCALPTGAIHVYRKCHLFGPAEAAAFTPGKNISPIFEIGGTRAGMLICYDVEFAEWSRALALAGAELLIVPTALPKSPANDLVARMMVPTRALENHASLIYAGLCGEENGLSYQGGSCIVGPDGVALATAGLAPALLTTKLHQVLPSDEIENPYLTDRQPALYHSLLTSNI